MVNVHNVKKDDRVIVNNPASEHNGKKGIAHTPGVTRGWYIRFDDGSYDFVPWGVEKYVEEE